MESECKKNKKYPKVVVLMSAYNGEQYITEQIESILNQTYPNLELYVRDDGSKDQTATILKKYEQDGKLHFSQGENLGFINSFFEVMRSSGEADYYAWCDQDDVWLPEKIERAVKKLQKDKFEHKNEAEQPVLYFSSYDYYNCNMKFEKHGLVHQRGPSFANSLLDWISLGFNSVFNQCARKMMLEHQPEHCCGHDWWTYMVCAAFGRVIYDKNYVSVKYRRLEKSVSPGGKNFLAMQIWRFKKFFLNDYFKNIREQLVEFAYIYMMQLKPKDQKVMELFKDGKHSISKTIKKIFYPVWFRQGVVEEIMVRGLFLLGKL